METTTATVTFKDGTTFTTEILVGTDEYIATLMALTDLARKGTYREHNEVDHITIG